MTEAQAQHLTFVRQFLSSLGAVQEARHLPAIQQLAVGGSAAAWLQCGTREPHDVDLVMPLSSPCQPDELIRNACWEVAKKGEISITGVDAKGIDYVGDAGPGRLEIDFLPSAGHFTSRPFTVFGDDKQPCGRIAMMHPATIAAAKLAQMGAPQDGFFQEKDVRDVADLVDAGVKPADIATQYKRGCDYFAFLVEPNIDRATMRIGQLWSSAISLPNSDIEPALQSVASVCAEVRALGSDSGISLAT